MFIYNQLVFLLSFGFCLTRDLPSNFPRCYRDDPNLNDCLLKASETVRPFLIKGVKEIELPPVEPYVVPSATVEQGSDNLSFKTTLTNLTLNGLSTYKFKHLKFDPKTLVWDIQVAFEKLNIVSDCDFEGTVLIAPLKGHGVLKIEQENPSFTTIVSGELIKRKGQDYFNITNLSVDFPIPKTSVRLEDFTGVRQDIIEIINNSLEQNTQVIVTEFSSTLRELLKRFNARFYKGLFRGIPYNKIFPLKPQ